MTDNTTGQETGQETGQAAAKDWREGISEDLRGNASLEGITDFSALAKNYINLVESNATSIRVPSENASTEEVTKFNEQLLTAAPNLMKVPDATDEAGVTTILNKLGRPADLNTYAVEGKEVPTSLKEQAHAMGLTQKQFGQLYANTVAPTEQANAEAATALKNGRDALAAEWGYAFGNKEQQATAILTKTGAPAELIAQATSGALGAETLKWVDSLATSLGREGLNIVNQAGGSTSMTPAEATAQIGEIMNNRQHAYWNTQDIGNQKAVQDMLDLQRLAHPSS